MTYELDVNSCKEKHNLLPNWFIVVFVVGMVILSILFYPAKFLVYQALTSVQNQRIAIYYLNKLIDIYPNNIDLKIALIKQEIDQHQWSLAEFGLVQLEHVPNLKSEIILLHYRMEYTKAFQELDKTKQQKQFAELRKELPNLSKLPLNKSQLLYLATLALSLNDAQTALDAYLRMAKIEKITDPELLSTIGQVASGAKQYQLSAQYYLAAVNYEKTLDKKRQDTINALKVLLAGNFVNEGVHILQTLPENIWSNKAMLLFMTKYALSANRTDLAAIYIKRALLLPGI